MRNLIITVLLIFTLTTTAQEIKIYEVSHEILIENGEASEKRPCKCEIQIYPDEIRMVKLNSLKTVVIFKSKNGVKADNNIYTSFETSVQVNEKVFVAEVRFLKKLDGVFILTEDGNGYGMINLED